MPTSYAQARGEDVQLALSCPRAPVSVPPFLHPPFLLAFTPVRHVCRLQGSFFYLGGCAIVVYGWPVVGLLFEAYGFWLLFCEFFPTVLQVRSPYL